MRIHADDLPPRTDADIRRLEAACREPFDTTDIPEITEENIRSGKLQPSRRTVAVTLDLDADLAERIRDEPPARINKVLRDHFASSRRAVRNEIRR